MGGNRRFNMVTVREIRNRVGRGESQGSLSREFHVGVSTIYNIVQNIHYHDENYTPPPVAIAGSRPKNSKLTDNDVRDIRKSTKSVAELVKIYGVAKSTIISVRTRNTYKDVKDE